MAFADLFPPTAPRDRRAAWTWPALLIASALLSGVTFECVTPFSAFAVLAAATMTLPRALAMVAAIWLVNQALGFVALGYPLDGTTFAWGGAIGIAALAATIGAAAVMGAARAWPLWSRIAIGFAAAFIVYEALLLLATPTLGGAANFTSGIVAELALSDACWLVGVAILRHGLSRLEAICQGGRRPVTT